MEMTERKNTTVESSYYLPPDDLPQEQPMFRGEWDEQGVYVYQALCDEIADWALEHQKFGGPFWKKERMSWIKPSFAWMLYRSGYGKKSKQERVLKIKLSHETIAYLLSQCQLVNTMKHMKSEGSAEFEGTGRIQWDPERDLFRSEMKEPKKMLRRRAIQIGLSGALKQEWFVDKIISIEDVTSLAQKVHDAHALESEDDIACAMERIKDLLPNERPYLPALSQENLQSLALLPGLASDLVIRLGKHKLKTKKEKRNQKQGSESI